MGEMFSHLEDRVDKLKINDKITKIENESNKNKRRVKLILQTHTHKKTQYCKTDSLLSSPGPNRILVGPFCFEASGQWDNEAADRSGFHPIKSTVNVWLCDRKSERPNAKEKRETQETLICKCDI